ncbi:MAG: UbiD family decarboxylase domain-containing protein [Nitrososphaeria archaeon]
MSLREVVEQYASRHPDDVLEINEAVSTEYEITAIANEVENRAPLLIFSNVLGYPGFRVVSNVFSSKKRIAAYFGLKDEGEFYSFWRRIMKVEKEPEIRERASSEVETMKGKNVDLNVLPVPKHYPQDGGRYITSGLIVSRKPDDPRVINLSFARIQVISRNEVALSLHSRGHLWSYFEMSKERKTDLPISVIIGAHPIYYLLAAARIENEYLRVGGVVNDHLVKGLTNDIPVPASSEIVLEGKIKWNEFYKEGPFTEYTGYISNRSTNNYAIIDAMMIKKNPIYLEINPSNSKEHIILSSIAKEPLILETVSSFYQTSSSYALEWPLKGVHYVLFGKIPKPQKGEAMQLALLLLGLDHYLKIVIISENETSLKFFDLISGILCDYRYAVLDEVLCNRLDPSASPEGTSSKLILLVKPQRDLKIINFNDDVYLERCGKKLHIGRQIDENAEANIVVGNDIDPRDEDQVLWALATRFQPRNDLKVVNGKIVIYAKKEGLNAPKLPDEAIKKAKQILLLAKVPS